MGFTKSFFIIAIASGCCLPAQAQHLWLQAEKYRFQAGETAAISLMTGENFSGDFWHPDQPGVELLRLLWAAGEKDLRAQIKKQKGKNIEVLLPLAGTQLFALKSGTTCSRQTGRQFEQYLAEAGLDAVLKMRQARNDTAGVNACYTHFGKLLLHVDNRADDTFKKAVGFPLEIIPLQHPYRLKSGDYLDCRILYQNKPLAHHKVNVWSFIGNRIFLQNIFTENDGSVRFPISNAGPWMVSTAAMEKSAQPGVDYQSLRATFVFGID